MAIPKSFETCNDYIQEMLLFLEKYQWLYNYRNTHILVEKQFSIIAIPWKDYILNLSQEDLQNIFMGKFDHKVPSSLIHFLKSLEAFEPELKLSTVKLDFVCPHNSGLSKKKIHEIQSLAPLIEQTCQAYQCDLIVDIGSGLGYLSHFLYSKYNYKVLGLEASEEFLHAAYRHQEKYHPASRGCVKFCRIYIKDDSCEDVERLIEEHFNKAENICITGLHACADLSIDILHLFAKMKSAKALVVMPCCYHRIQCKVESNRCEYFKNFPSSLVFKEEFHKHEFYRFIRRPFLRLACQRRNFNIFNLSEEESNCQARSWMFRAIFQAVVEEEKYCIRVKSSLEKLKSVSNDDDAFLEYVCTLQNKFVFEQAGSICNAEVFTEKMWKKYLENQNNLILFKFLMAFQARIQNMCENFVLMDRVQLLKQNGLTCDIRKVTDDFVSPRCFALVCVR
ncbi:probable methyltransferase-like protein 25 [Cylas formicarius]|uniref:probable methyltransferase-like protein 25 n=1 Tax=Cylas formicarius TaxID=197179 RepID=UPI002958DB1B|nr:probable methyltransferase-like protein 25 [Cylas formicarius]